MQFTRAEQSTIEVAERALFSAWSLLPYAGMTNAAQKIAAMRFVIGAWSRSTEQAVLQRQQLILCKLLAAYPEVENAYIVTRRVVAPENSAIARILPAYIKTMNSLGMGTWSHRQHECVMSTFFSVADPGSDRSVVVIDRASLQSLIRSFYTQETAALSSNDISAPESRISVRAAQAETALQESAIERKKAARDLQGTCYTCSAPKPRRTRCAVCGYLPRGAS